MKHNFSILALCLLVAAFSLQAASAAPARPAKARAAKAHPLWVSAYYAIWVQQAGTLTPQQIDYSAFSHLIHFAVVPADDGTIDPVKGGITPAESRAVLVPAHKAHRRVLLSVGGWLTSTHFRAAYSDPHRAAFINALVQIVRTRGYDGLDIDMEPLLPTDAPGYEAFIRQLRAQMTAADPKLLLTAATAAQPKLFAHLAAQFNQINLMTYDLSGPWQGFKTWYNSALYGNGEALMNPGQPFPSASGMVERFTAAGVPRPKLGIGEAFYGCVWTGADGPGQSIQGVTMNGSVSYAGIMNTYYQPGRYHWDAQAQAPYLSIDAPQKQFVSYDNEALCAKKVNYARAQGLGGVMIWELGSGYLPSRPAGQRNPLLQAVKRAWLSP
jgi:chitinase